MLIVTAASFLLPTAILLQNPDTDTGLRAAATMPAALNTDEDLEFTLTIAIDEGWSVQKRGVPNPVLQIDLPPSIELTGEVIEGHRALSRNEFMEEPFERFLKVGENTIGFRITGKPAEGETIGLSILAFLNAEDDSRFVRQRLELPVQAGAAAHPGDAANSRWGRTKTLNIGDRATSLTLTRADGTEVPLDTYLGKKNVIVATYRAHW